MKHHAYQWAAYRGDERLEVGPSKRDLYRKYLGKGLQRDELIVLGTVLSSRTNSTERNWKSGEVSKSGRPNPGQRDSFADRPPFPMQIESGIAIYPRD